MELVENLIEQLNGFFYPLILAFVLFASQRCANYSQKVALL